MFRQDLFICETSRQEQAWTTTDEKPIDDNGTYISPPQNVVRCVVYSMHQPFIQRHQQRLSGLEESGMALQCRCPPLSSLHQAIYAHSASSNGCQVWRNVDGIADVRLWAPCATPQHPFMQTVVRFGGKWHCTVDVPFELPAPPHSSHLCIFIFSVIKRFQVCWKAGWPTLNDATLAFISVRLLKRREQTWTTAKEKLIGR